MQRTAAVHNNSKYYDQVNAVHVVFLVLRTKFFECLKAPAGIISDSVVAEADLMTLLSGLVVACLSASPDSMRWRALRAARSLMAFGMEGESLSAAALAPPLAPPLLLLARSHASPELPAVFT